MTPASGCSISQIGREQTPESPMLFRAVGPRLLTRHNSGLSSLPWQPMLILQEYWAEIILINSELCLCSQGGRASGLPATITTDLLRVPTPGARSAGCLCCPAHNITANLDLESIFGKQSALRDAEPSYGRLPATPYAEVLSNPEI